MDPVNVLNSTPEEPRLKLEKDVFPEKNKILTDTYVGHISDSCDITTGTSNQMKNFVAMAYSEEGTSNITEKVMFPDESNHQTELGNLLESDADPQDVAAGRGRNRSEPMRTQEERKKRKKEIDGKHRAKRKMERQIFTNLSQHHGGIEGMESKLNKLKEMESINGRFEEMESKLNKVELLEAESAVFEKVKAMFGGIDKILPGLNELKKTEFQHIVFKPNQMDKQIITLFPESSSSQQEECNHLQQAPNLNMDGSNSNSDWLGDYEICQMSLKADNLYSNALVDDFIAKLGKETKSNLTFLSFKDFDGECQKVGDYCFPISLVSTVKAIMNAYGDIATNCLMGPKIVENIYIVLCAAIKEMGDLSLQQVSEETMLKWRDAIKDAQRINFDVQFAVNHLHSIAYAYFGLKAQKDRNCCNQLLETLKAKEQELASEKCKMCQEHARSFQDKDVGLF